MVLQGAGLILFTRDVIGHSARQVFRHLCWPLVFSVAGGVLVYTALHGRPDPLIMALSGAAFVFVYVAGQFWLDRELFLRDLTGLRRLARAG